MMHTRPLTRSARFWPRLLRPLVPVFLLLTVTLCPCGGAAGRGADPPPQPGDPVDDFRAAFRKNMDTIANRSRELPDLRRMLREAQQKFDEDPNKQSNIDDLTRARDNVAKAEKELTTAFETRNAALNKYLKEALANGDPAERVALVNVIGDEPVPLRYNSKLTPDYLSKLHPEVPYLVELTQPGPDHPLELRVAAALALGKTSGDGKVIIPALAKLLRNQENPVALRLAAAEAIGRPVNRIIQAASLLTPGPGKPDAEKVDSRVELGLILIDTGHLAWPVLMDGLKDPSRRVRLACADAAKDLSSTFFDQAEIATSRTFFADHGPLLKAFRDQMPKLLTAVEDRDPAINQLALSIVEDLAVARLRLSKNLGQEELPKPMSRGGEPRPEALPAFLPTRLQAPPAKEPAPAPRPADSGDLQAALLQTLPALVKALHSPNVDTRRHAGYVLEDLGGDALGVLPDLTAALSDTDRFVRWTMLRTLGRLAPKEATVVVPAVIPLVADPDIDARAAALKTLERYGKDAAGMGAGPAIAKLLPRDDTSIMLAGLKALQAIGDWDGPTLEVVADLLKSSDASVRVGAAQALGRAGAKAAAFLPALEFAMTDSEEKVRIAASEALLRIKK